MHNKTAFAIGLPAGILMIFAGVVGGVGFWSLLPLLVTLLGLPSEWALLVNTVILVLSFIAGLGGFAVILGSLLYLVNQVRLGKFIVGLGAGMGLVGFILFLAENFITGTLVLTWLFALLQTPGFLGVVLSIISRTLARNRKD
jgi:hypothetical protein